MKPACRFLMLSALAGLWVPPAASSEQPPPPALTEAEALALAHQTVRGVDELARASAYAAKADRRVRRWRDPELRFGFNQRTEDTALLPTDDRGSRTSKGVALRIYLPHPAQAAALKKLANNRQAYYRTLEATWSWAFTHQVRQSFLDVVFAQQDLEAAERLVDVRRRARQAVEESSEAGVATSGEVLRTAGDLLDTLGERNEARLNLHLARLHLGRLTGQDHPEGTAARVETREAAPAPKLGSVDDLVQLARALHPAWHLLEVDMEDKRAERAVARASRWPWFSHIQAGYGELDWDRDLDAEEWEIQTGIVLPVFSWVGDPGSRSLEELALLEAEQAEALDRLQDDLGERLAVYRSARKAYDTENDDLPLVQEIRTALAADDGALPDPRWRAALEIRLIERERRILKQAYQRDTALLKVEALTGARLLQSL